MTRVALGLVVLALLASAGSAFARGGAQPFRITSSLDGKKVLPIKSRWLAYPKVPSAKVAEVDFLIDGKVRCVEHYSPYNYGSDDFHGHFGSLVTSWLTPGKHRFTATAILANGQKASDTNIVRVLPAPRPPAVLARGRWQRTVTRESIAKLNAELPPGQWELIFDRVGIWELDPIGSGGVEHVVFKGDTMIEDAPVWMVPYVNGHANLNRFGHTDLGSGFREDGPPARYRWSVTGDELTLTAVDEPCEFDPRRDREHAARAPAALSPRERRRALAEARVRQSDRLDEGPHGSRDGRGGRAGRSDRAR
jgi:hypothetical protein